MFQPCSLLGSMVDGVRGIKSWPPYEKRVLLGNTLSRIQLMIEPLKYTSYCMMNTKVTEITDAFMVIKNDYASTKTLKIYIF